MVKQQQHISLRDYVCVGMPPSLRGMIWQVVSKSRHNSDTIELEYNALLKKVSPHEKIIQRDLARTFPTHTFFRHSEEGGGQEMLFNVIKAYSLYDPQVGYCQGLPFVVGCLLLHVRRRRQGKVMSCKGLTSLMHRCRTKLRFVS